MVALGALAVAALAATCGGGSYGSTPSTMPSPPSSGGTADVTITITGQQGNMSFSPSPATAKVGQKVAWRNADNITHTATQTGGAFSTGAVAGGATSSPITVNTAGSFPYACSIHPAMTGVLNVTP